MPLLLKTLLYDEDASEHGRWFDFELDARTKCSRSHNKKWTEWMRKRSESNPDAEMSESDWAELLAHAGLTDWENIEIEPGVPYECNYENRLDALNKYDALRQHVLVCCHRDQKFRLHDDDEKNS